MQWWVGQGRFGGSRRVAEGGSGGRREWAVSFLLPRRARGGDRLGVIPGVKI